MSFKDSLLWLQRVLLAIASLSTIYLYFYPILLGCAFPSTTDSLQDGFYDTLKLHTGELTHQHDNFAPFRLLVLADPQLEGDSSLPDPEDALVARIRVHAQRLRDTASTNLTTTLAEVVQDLVLEDIPRSIWSVRKTLDLFGNDYYLAHIFRTLHWWTKPSHVTVLGDLIGSQWVSDDEFSWRSWRYWNRVFAGTTKVDDAVMSLHTQNLDKQNAIPLDDQTRDWTSQVINVVGNHDIGYAGDITPERVDRFEREFGKVNWDVHFSYPAHKLPGGHAAKNSLPPSLHLIVLNSMILDTPALHESIQSETYEYLNGLISNRLDPVEDRNATFTLLLTHVPLHKPDGVCVDAPLFEFWDDDEDDGRTAKKGGLREQNHLSDHSSRVGVLQGVFGMSGDEHAVANGKGRNGLILTGHDHEGCDTVHYVERTHQLDNDAVDGSPPSISWSWNSIHTSRFPGIIDKSKTGMLKEEVVTSLREVTLRSMMGEYSGNAGLLSLWYDFKLSEWRYEIQMCPLGIQHIWWAVHIIDIVAVVMLLVRLLLSFLRSPSLRQGLPDATSVKATLVKPQYKKGSTLDVPIAEQRHDRSPSPRRRKG